MIEMTTPTVEAIEQKLADLRQHHATLTAAIADDEADLAGGDVAVGRAQAVYDEVLRARADAFPKPDGYGEWKPRDEREEQRAREAVQRADGMFAQADNELSAALAARNAISQRRSNRRMIRRQVEDAITAAERELELARQVPPADRDLLASIRLKVFGRPAATR